MGSLSLCRGRVGMAWQSSADILAVLDQVLKGCGVRSRGEFAEIINDEDGVKSFVDECRLAIARAVVPPPCADIRVQTETATVTVGTTVHSFVNVATCMRWAPWQPFHLSPELGWSAPMLSHTDAT